MGVVRWSAYRPYRPAIIPIIDEIIEPQESIELEKKLIIKKK